MSRNIFTVVYRNKQFILENYRPDKLYFLSVLRSIHTSRTQLLIVTLVYEFP